MLLISKTFSFEAAHRLHGYKGDCSRWHGHSYHGEVVFKVGKLGPIGIGIDFKKIKKIIEDVIVKPYDHFSFEDFVYNSTAEVQALIFAEKLLVATAELEEPVKLVSVKVYETVGSYAQWINPAVDGEGLVGIASEIATLMDDVKTKEEIDNENQ